MPNALYKESDIPAIKNHTDPAKGEVSELYNPIPKFQCPSGMGVFSGYTTTVSRKGWGGSTTNCLAGSSGSATQWKECNTGSHDFSDRGQETCTADKLLACGSRTQGSETIYAAVKEVGCLPLGL
jgi:hypothetical protein